jgi:hypothetical protein
LEVKFEVACSYIAEYSDAVQVSDTTMLIVIVTPGQHKLSLLITSDYLPN